MQTAQRRLLLVATSVLALLAACSPNAGTTPEDGGATDSGPCQSANPCDCCAAGAVCFEGQCCTPRCEGRGCGSDGCGGSCGSCEQANYTCNEQSGQCECAREDDQAFCAAQGKPCGSATGKDRCGRDATVSCSFCGEHEVCDLEKERCECVPETDAELCGAAGKSCGALVTSDRCGFARSLDCGGCDVGFVCEGATSSSCVACVPDDVTTVCATHQAACGSFSGVDNCGENRQLDCGGCAPGSLCNAATNQCDPCSSETDAEYCARVATPGLDCGTVAGEDNCHVARTFDCGSCTAPRWCDATNHCQACAAESDAVFCAENLAECGAASGVDRCGANRTVAECGPCSSPTDRCESGRCVACVPELDADLCTFFFKTCGTPTLIDHCGLTRTPNCGPATGCANGLSCIDGVCNDGLRPLNDTCASPQRLVFDATNTAAASGDLALAFNDYSGSCGGGGNDLVYAFTLTQPMNADVRVAATNTSAQPMVYLRTTCATWNDLGCVSAPSTGASATLTARGLGAGDYFVIVDAYGTNNGTFDLTVTLRPPPPPPANDTCATAETLTFVNGVATVTGDTSSATNDYIDTCMWSPLDGPDVVYKFTVSAPSALVATVSRDASATTFYPALQVLSSCPGAGNALACGLQSNGVAWASVSSLAAGDYYLVVDAVSASRGPFTLEVRLVPPATNDLCSNATPVALTPVAGSTTDLEGTVSGDTSIASDDYTSSCNSGGTGRDLVYSFTVPPATEYAVDVVVTPTLGSRLQPTLFVKTGCGPTDSEKGCVSQYTFNPATLHFNRLRAGTYMVFVDGYSIFSNGPFTLSITATTPPAAPVNDTCGRGTPVTLDAVTGAAQLAGTTALATDDSVGSCTNLWDLHTGADVVYTVTMPLDGGLLARVTPDIATSPNYMPVVYIQAVCGDNSTDLACGNYNWSGYATVTANGLTSGSTYYVIVDGRTATEGAFTLDLVAFAPLTNDGCASAKTMVFDLNGDFADRGDMCSATNDTMDISGQGCAWSSGYGTDIVYKLVTNRAKNLSMRFHSGQAWGSQIYIRTACAVGSSQIMCNDAPMGSLNTMLAKNLPAGEYYLWLDNGYYGDCGVFTFSAHLSDPLPPPSNDDCANAETIAIDSATGIGAVSGGTTESAANDADGTCAPGGVGGGEVFYKFTLGAEKTVRIEVTPQSSGSDLKPIVYLRSDCGQPSSELGCTAVAATGTAAHLAFARLAAGDYYLVVDSADMNATGPFDLTVTTTTPPAPAANDLCAFATPLPPFDTTTLTTSITGDTLAAYNDDTSGCAQAGRTLSGPDLVYSFQLPADARVTAKVIRDPANTTYRPAVAIRRACGASAEVACSTEPQYPVPGTASLTTTLTQGLWYVVVDGVDGSFGPFTLEVSQDSAATLVAGDTCGNAIPLVFSSGGGSTVSVSGDLSTAGLTDDYAGTACATFYSSPDMVYTLTLTADSIVTITMAASAVNGSRLDPGSYLRRVCDDPATEVACAASSVDGSSVTYTTPRLAPGTYYLFADSWSTWYTGGFDLTVTVNAAAGAAPGNDACAGALPVNFDPTTGTAQVTGDTSNAFDTYSGSGNCGPFTGPLSGGDLVYSVTVPQGATLAAVVTRDASAVGYVPAVYIRDDCASPYAVHQLACNTPASVSSGAATTGAMATNVATTGTYYVIVDGQAGTGGAFTLDLFLQTTPIDNASCATSASLAFTTSATTGAALARVVGDTMLGANLTQGIRQGSQDCYSSGNELYYDFTTAGTKDLTVELTPLTNDYAPAVYLRSDCGDANAQLVCNYAWNGPITLQKLRLPQGSYTLVVDSESSSFNGPYSMKVTLVDPPPPPSYDTCRAPQALTLPASGSPALVVDDSTLPANDDYRGACATANDPMDGGDVVYAFNVSAATQVTARVTPKANSPRFRPAVYIRSTCAAVSDDICAFPGGAGPTAPAAVTASLPTGNYFLIVDGVAATAGDFTLELSQDMGLFLEGDHCIDAKSLDSDFLPGTRPNEVVASFAGTTAGAVNDGDGSCASWTGPDLVYRFTVARGSVLSVEVAPDVGSSYWPHFYLRSSCTDRSSELTCFAPAWGNSAPGSATLFGVQPGTYYLFVDSYSPYSGGGAFTGTVSVRDTPPPPANDDCRFPTPLQFVAGATSTQQVATLLGEESSFATDGGTGGCFAANGADVVYQFTTAASAAQSFEATVTPGSSSPWLRPSAYLRTGTCGSSAASAEVTCGFAPAANAAVTIRANRLAPGTTYYLIVDSAPHPGEPPGGKFDLTVTLDAAATNVPANDGCSSARQIVLTGQAPSVTTLNAQTTVGATDDTRLDCGDVGPDVVYYFELTAEAQVTAKVTGAPGYNPAIMLRSSCGTAEIVCAPSGSGTIAEATAAYMPPGRYYLWVDAGSPNSSGSFDIELTLETPAVAAPPANDLCNGTLPALTKGVPVTGTTVGAFDNYHGACGAGTPGPDIVYTYTPATDGLFTVRLVSNTADLAIWMTRGLCGDVNSCLIYNDSGGGYGGIDSFSWPGGKAGATYYLVIDSYMPTNNGDFELTVN